MPRRSHSRRQPAEHLHVLLKNVIRHFDGIGIILEPHQRREWMAAPEVKRVHPVGDEEIQVFPPELLVVEPREQFRRVGILVNVAARQDVGFLHPDAGAAQLHHRRVVKIQIVWQLAGFANSSGQFETAVKRAGIVFAENPRISNSVRKQHETFVVQIGLRLNADDNL